MAKKNHRQKIERLLSRAEREDPELFEQARQFLGISGFITDDDLEAELKALPNEKALEAIEMLEPLKGPDQTVSPQLAELSADWQRHLDSVEGEADPDLLAKARELASPQKIHMLDFGDDRLKSHLAMYLQLKGALDTEYDKQVGLLSQIRGDQFNLIYLRMIKYKIMEEVLERFTNMLITHPYRTSIRRRIQKLALSCADLREAREVIAEYIENKLFSGRTQKAWLIEVAILIQMMADYPRLKSEEEMLLKAEDRVEQAILAANSEPA